MKWNIKAKHLNDEKRVIGLEVEDEDGSFDANIRWDGGMEIHLHSTTEENVEFHDTIHTYDLDGLIEKLQGLRSVCVDYFSDWNEK